MTEGASPTPTVWVQRKPVTTHSTLTTAARGDRHPDCFWCGALLFRSGSLLVCPSDGAMFDAETYLTDHHTD